MRTLLKVAAISALLLTATVAEGKERSRRHSVPEFDPAAAGAVVALIAAGGVLVARRKGRK